MVARGGRSLFLARSRALRAEAEAAADEDKDPAELSWGPPADLEGDPEHIVCGRIPWTFRE